MAQSMKLEVLERPEHQDTMEIIKEASRRADLVFLGMAAPDPEDEAAYAQQLLSLVDGLPTTILLRNASRFQGRLL